MDDILHVPIPGELVNLIPLHAGAIFTKQQDQIKVAVEARIEDAMVEEMQTEVQKGDLGGETL